MTLTETQKRDLLEVACGYTRGYSPRTCDSLCRLGYLTGDWDCGYYLTDKGRLQVETLEVGRTGSRSPNGGCTAVDFKQ